MRQKLISIILATYNCGAKVEKTIQSIVSQNKELFELIVVDGNSTDETLNSIRKYEDDLTLISESDTGVYDAYNKGINAAGGKYLYFIGAGDCLRANILDCMKPVLQPENLDFVYGDAFFSKDKVFYGGKFSNLRLCFINICHQTIFYHRSIFSRLGNFELDYRINSDWVLNMRCFGNLKVKRIYVHETIADFEGGGLSETGIDNYFYKNLSSIIIENFGFQTYTNFLRQSISAYFSLVFQDLYWKIYCPVFRPFVGQFIRYQIKMFKNVKNSSEK